MVGHSDVVTDAQYWELKKLEYAAHGRRLGASVTMAEWILGVSGTNNFVRTYCASGIPLSFGKEGLFCFIDLLSSFSFSRRYSPVAFNSRPQVAVAECIGGQKR